MKKIGVVMLAMGVLFSGVSFAEETKPNVGAEIFAKHCGTCHGPAGEGNEPFYPALVRIAGLREPRDIVSTLITGRFRRAGEINGHTIPIMPSWGRLSNAEIAAVVNYVKAEFGDGATVSEADVAAISEELWELD